MISEKTKMAIDNYLLKGLEEGAEPSKSIKTNFLYVFFEDLQSTENTEDILETYGVTSMSAINIFDIVEYVVNK